MDTNDSPQLVCPRCGSPLPADAPEGLCPRCLAAVNLDSVSLLTGAGVALPPPPIEEIAPHFPQLEIIECLGRGGMGVVYKARQKSLDRIVALKLLTPERVTDVEFEVRFANEAKALAALSHPNIVTIHDFGQADGFYYLLMEFVDGVNLRQAMRAGRFTPEQALAIVPPVCEALQYAHGKGIVHRDIKPENLLLDKDGRVKIADFGIAKILGGEVEMTAADLVKQEESMAGMSSLHTATLASVAGTPQYMAPEQTEHRRTDHRADIYSLGVVLYELLTGELPTDKFQPPSGKVRIDVRLDEVVLRALEFNPELRWQTAGIFKTQVETIVGTPTGGDRREEVQTETPKTAPSSETGDLNHIRRQLFSGGFFLALMALGMGINITPFQPFGVAIVAWGVLLSVIAVAVASTAGNSLTKLKLAGSIALINSIGLFSAVIPLALDCPWMRRTNSHILIIAASGCAIIYSIKKLFNTWSYRNHALSSTPNNPSSSSDVPLGFSRTPAIWAAWVCMVVVFSLLAFQWWSRREPEGVWMPTPISDSIGEQFGRAQLRVTDVSRTGQVVLVDFVCETLESDHELIVQYSGPVPGYPANLVSSVNTKEKAPDCLISPTSMIGGTKPGMGDVLAGSRDMAGRQVFQIGFVLPDEKVADQVAGQVRQVHLGKPRGLTEKGSVLLLFALHRNVGKDPDGKPVSEGLSGMLFWSPKQSSNPNSKPADVSGLSFGPVIERLVDDAIDFDTGRTGTTPLNGLGKAGTDAIFANIKGIEQAGWDVIQDNPETIYGIGMKAVPLAASTWDALSPRQILELVKAAPVQVFIPFSPVTNFPATYAFQTREGGTGILQITGFTADKRGVKIRYKMVQNANASAATPVDRHDQIAVEDLALHMIVAIREKDDNKLRSLACDRVKDWRDALPVFAVELREHYRQSTGNESFDMRAGESLVDGDLAAVKCTGPKELTGKCLVLFFVKTADGWRNHSLRASMENVPLAQHMANLKKEIQKEGATLSAPGPNH
jgi:serine/threonine protein kinase